MVSEIGQKILGITIGFIAYILLYLGKGIQKYAIEGFKGVQKESEENKRKKTGKQAKNTLIWAIGTALTVAFLFVQWIPLTIFDIPMNLIAPLEGFGLIVLLLFSYFVLHEKITRIVIIGAGLVIIGIVVINLIVTSQGILTRDDVNFKVFWTLFGMIFGVETAAILVFTLLFKIKRWAGISISLLAGTCMAFQTLSKRISDVEDLKFIFVFVVFAFATATLFFTQWAFTKIQANLVVPIFISISIILTVVLGNLVVGEQIKAIQTVGFCIIVVGVVLISAFQSQEKI